MPTWPSIEAFERELTKVERRLERERRDMGMAVAEAAKPEGYRAAAEDLGGDPKFSGWRPWLELQVKPKNYGAVILPTRQSAGPWTVAQFGRNQGNGGGGAFFGPGANRRTGTTRRRKDGSVAKVRAFKARRWNGRTAGKGTADDARKRFERIAEVVGEKEFKLVLKRHFDVS